MRSCSRERGKDGLCLSVCERACVYAHLFVSASVGVLLSGFLRVYACVCLCAFVLVFVFVGVLVSVFMCFCLCLLVY